MIKKGTKKEDIKARFEAIREEVKKVNLYNEDESDEKCIKISFMEDSIRLIKNAEDFESASCRLTDFNENDMLRMNIESLLFREEAFLYYVSWRKHVEITNEQHNMSKNEAKEAQRKIDEVVNASQFKAITELDEETVKLSFNILVHYGYNSDSYQITNDEDVLSGVFVR